MRDLWTAIVYYVSVLWHGELHLCDHCGRLEQCLYVAEELPRHWAYCLKTRQSMGEQITLDDVSSPMRSLTDLRLCVNCSCVLEEQYKLHERCCKPLMRGVWPTT